MAELLLQPSSLDEDGSLSIADMMAGLMVVFMFIAITYIRNVSEQRDAVREIAVTWQESEVAILDALRDEFEDDLQRWNAEIDAETLAVRFKSPEVLFATGSAELRPEFADILRDFFPRYLRVLGAHSHNLSEIRIEGHTSSAWNRDTSPEDAYFLNMALSQERTRSVLQHVLGLREVEANRDWARGMVTANGLSSSQLIERNGGEDPEASRRVEFKIRTNAKTQILRVLDTLEAG